MDKKIGKHSRERSESGEDQAWQDDADLWSDNPEGNDSNDIVPSGHRDSSAPPAPPGYRASKTSGSYEPNRRYPEAAAGITTSMKIGWMALGVFLSVLSLPIVLALYWRRDIELKYNAFRYALIGIGIGLILEFLLVGWLTSAYPELVNQVLNTTAAEPGSSGWTSTNF